MLLEEFLRELPVNISGKFMDGIPVKVTGRIIRGITCENYRENYLLVVVDFFPQINKSVVACSQSFV